MNVSGDFMKNNKGFTLIELVAVLAILIAILLLALPGVASSYERRKEKINNEKIESIKSAGQIYASIYKKDIDYSGFLKGECGISIQMLLDNDLITKDELMDSENKKYLYENFEKTTVIYIKDNGSYVIDESGKKECKK